MNRAYSILNIKAVDSERRIITGIATTPEPDRVGDIVEPLGVQFKNPMPLLWQHKTDKPVGTVKFDKPTKNGITFEAKLPAIDESGTLKDRIDEAWQSVKAGLVRAVSIGFRSIEHAFMKDGGIHYLETEVLELSLVTVPANADATIQSVKSIDNALLAATGQSQSDDDRPTPPGASGKKRNPVVKAQEAKTMPKKTIAEQISAFEATRQAKAGRMSEIMEDAGEKGETLDAPQKEEYDTLDGEVKSVDEHLVRLRALEKANVTAAKAVEKVTDVKSGSDARSGGDPIRVSVKNPNLPKGIAFVRYVGALAFAKGNRLEAAEFAKSKWHDSTPEVEMILRAPVNPGTTTDATWAEPLVQYQNMTAEFIEFLRPQTIIGRIPGLRRVPFNIKVPRQTAGATVNWVGEAKVKPVSALAFDSLTLGWTKIAGIVPLSEELVRFSSPSAEELVKADLTAAIAQFMDREFIDPTKAVAAGVSPASITNGVTPVSASGTTAAALRADIKSLFSNWIAANLSAAGGVWIMTESMALSISLMRTALDTPEFPGITLSGGTLLGLPVIVSENIPSTGGSPADGSLIILVKASDIMLADDGQVSIDVSREASLQMESAPDSPATASTVMVSLWQQNLVGIKCERYINWVKRRAEAVQFIQNAKYAA